MALENAFLKQNYKSFSFHFEKQVISGSIRLAWWFDPSLKQILGSASDIQHTIGYQSFKASKKMTRHQQSLT